MLNSKKIENLDFSNFLRTYNDVQKVSIMRTLMNQIIEEIDFKGKNYRYWRW